MNARDIDGAPNYLSTIIRDPNPPAGLLEEDLEMVRNAINQQVNVASALRNDWFHILSDNSFRQTRLAEQVLLLSRYLHTACTSKERLLRFGTRYVLTDRIYERQVRIAEVSPDRRQEWLQHDNGKAQVLNVMRTVETTVRRLNTTLKEIQERMQQVEHRIKEEGTNVDAAQLLERTMNMVNEKLNDMVTQQVPAQVALEQALREKDQIIAALQQQLQICESQHIKKPEQPAEAVITEPNLKRKRGERQVPQEQVAEEQLPALEDDAYLQHMINEVTEEEEQPQQDFLSLHSISSEENDQPRERVEQLQVQRIESPQEDVWIRIRSLNTIIQRMENDLRDFPYRQIGETSQGVEPWVCCIFCEAEAQHYSDSCPVVVRGDRRGDILVERGLCQYCLKDCPTKFCWGRHKRCYYCDRIRGTAFEDIILHDGGHHRALCTVPDEKGRMQRRLRDAKDERDWLLLNYDEG